MLTMFASVLFACSMAAAPGQEVRFAGLTPGVKLVLFDVQPLVLPEFLGIHLLNGTNQKPKKVSSLNDLAGYVQVQTPRAALDFVRLRTSRSTWDLDWGGDELECEVTSDTISKHAANYGIIPDSLAPKFEGWLGVLSERLFR